MVTRVGVTADGGNGGQELQAAVALHQEVGADDLVDAVRIPGPAADLQQDHPVVVGPVGVEGHAHARDADAAAAAGHLALDDAAQRAAVHLHLHQLVAEGQHGEDVLGGDVAPRHVGAQAAQVLEGEVGLEVGAHGVGHQVAHQVRLRPAAAQGVGGLADDPLHLGLGAVLVRLDDRGDLRVRPQLVLEEGDQGARVVGRLPAQQGAGGAVDQQDGVAQARAVAEALEAHGVVHRVDPRMVVAPVGVAADGEVDAGHHVHQLHQVHAAVGVVAAVGADLLAGGLGLLGAGDALPALVRVVGQPFVDGQQDQLGALPAQDVAVLGHGLGHGQEIQPLDVLGEGHGPGAGGDDADHADLHALEVEHQRGLHPVDQLAGLVLHQVGTDEGEVGQTDQALQVGAAQVEVVVAGHAEGVADGVVVLDDRRALGLGADGRALEEVAHVHQQDRLAGRLGLGADLLDVGGGRGTPAQGRREVGVHEPRRLRRDVPVQVVGPHQVQAQDAVFVPAPGRAGQQGRQGRCQQQGAASLVHLDPSFLRAASRSSPVRARSSPCSPRRTAAACPPPGPGDRPCRPPRSSWAGRGTGCR